jgi:uncharacterized protein YbcC (UPF0753/DUF2309 family)
MTALLAPSLPHATQDRREDSREDRRAAIEAAIDRACARIAPLWPLRHFVAVNPFLGFLDRPFEEACAFFRRVARIDMLMPRAFYRDAHRAGEIDDRDLEAAFQTASRSAAGPPDAAALRRSLALAAPRAQQPSAVVATVAEVLDRLAAGDRELSLTAFMVDEIAKFCAAYFDDGQAAWRHPWRHLAPYPAWRAAAQRDRNPEAMGVRQFRQTISALPDDPRATIAAVLGKLGIPDRAVDDYLFRALFDIGGWAGHARYRQWIAGLSGSRDEAIVDLLAIRLAWGLALFRSRDDAAFVSAWAGAMQSAAAAPVDGRLGDDPDLALDVILQNAFERSARRRLIEKLSRPGGRARAAGRPALQAAFCIDVRSEILRRALESTRPGIETFGFAGFFGFPIEYVPLGRVRGGAQCPVLLKPSHVVCEGVAGASPDEEKRIVGRRRMRRRLAKVWKAFKLSAVSSFTFVETAGLFYAAKIAGDTLALTRTVADPSRDGLDRRTVARLAPRIAPATVEGRATGFARDARLAYARAVLRGMSLTTGFARLVLLVGHGSQTTNNPYASGLDCGACGGHTGEANARVAATILNDPDVRAGLVDDGIVIPADTLFLGALHNTTTDAVTIFDAAAAAQDHAAELALARDAFADAAALARLERAALLGVEPAAADVEIARRSRDWSQVRPEWGLAGNAAFVAAPRAWTSGIDLEGRAFLHSYDWRADRDFAVLELIMTAPMVVASWINLQYFASTTNNQVFGSGNKVLHNVCATLGVIEGNAGDIRPGLPWQSVHDGTRYVHQPVRLNVFIAAPTDAIEGVLGKHADVRNLVENRWVFLHALTDDHAVLRYAGRGRWHPAGPEPAHG